MFFKKAGFTLVEMIIVVTIIAILAAVALVSFSGETINARNSKRFSDLKSLQTGISTSLAKNYNLRMGVNEKVKTNIGNIVPLRGASLELVKEKSFSSKLFPSIPQDPYNQPYVIAYLTPEIYQIYAVAEREDKSRYALINGSFKNGIEIDRLVESIRPDDFEIFVNHPDFFEVGDKLKIDKEIMTVVEIYEEDKVLEVERDYDKADFIFENTNISLYEMENPTLAYFESDNPDYNSGYVIEDSDVLIYGWGE
jgi:prepilin-type N-terminal cleavage/methylation domain-containing protein